MSELAHIAATIFKRAGKTERFIVGIAGPPASGKSTRAEALSELFPQGSAVVVPMDGFHYDDRVLDQIGLRHRKGAPETFDFAGFATLLRRLKSREPNIAIPLFDRSLEISRAGAAIVDSQVKFILVEGNYLLLDEEPWSGLETLFDFTIFVDVAREELERRLVARWREHGRLDDVARKWIDTNDMPNIDRVLRARRRADLVI
ncbi:MAG: nucleoside triphosphate hydrolase [Rhizobiaceae bacterium]